MAQAELAAKSLSEPSVQSQPHVSGEDVDVIETMVGVGEDNLVNARSLEHYRGGFAGLSMLQRVQNLCRHLSGIPRIATTEELEDDFVRAFDFMPPACGRPTREVPFHYYPCLTAWTMPLRWWSTRRAPICNFWVAAVFV